MSRQRYDHSSRVPESFMMPGSNSATRHANIDPQLFNPRHIDPQLQHQMRDNRHQGMDAGPQQYDASHHHQRARRYDDESYGGLNMEAGDFAQGRDLALSSKAHQGDTNLHHGDLYNNNQYDRQIPELQHGMNDSFHPQQAAAGNGDFQHPDSVPERRAR